MCSERVVVELQHVQLLLREVADHEALAFGDAAAKRLHARGIVFTSVDLPWPLAPRMPMRWPASTDARDAAHDDRRRDP